MGNKIRVFLRFVFMFIFVVFSFSFSSFVIGAAKDFNIPIYIQTPAGIEKASSDEIADILFNHDFELQEKQEYVVEEKCSLRAKAGRVEINGMTFDSNNKLSFNINLKNSVLGKGSLIVKKGSNRFSLSFNVKEILETNSEKLVLEASGKGRLNREEFSFDGIIISFDKINNLVEMSSLEYKDFILKGMEVTFTDGCFGKEEEFYLLVDKGELEKGRSIEEVRALLDQYPEFLDVYWNFEKLYKGYWWVHIPHVDTGSIWTTRNDCGNYSQNVNQYNFGEEVWINGENFKPGDYDWKIKGQPGGASCDPDEIVASGSFTVYEGGAFCFYAYTILPDDCKEYKVEFDGKHDNYSVIPEFGIVVGALTLVGAIAIFFFVRKK